MADERVALITGGAETAGEAIARELVRRCWKVVVQGTDEEELADAAIRLKELAPDTEQVATFPAELTRPEQRDQLVEFMLDEYERIDLLVCASTGPEVNETLLELAPPAYEEVLAACLTAPLFLTQLVANEMVRLTEAGSIEAAKIILLNTICAYTSMTERAARCLAAAAVSMMRKLFADGLAEHGINVYEIRASFISTGATDEVHARYGKLIEEGLTPIRRWGRQQDVALAVAAIAEDLLPYSTGQVIDVDGGFHLRRL